MITSLSYAGAEDLIISQAHLENESDEDFARGLKVRYNIQAPFKSGTYQVIFKTTIGVDNSYNHKLEATLIVIVVPSNNQAVSGASQIAAGDRHSLAILSDGSVWSWGLNDHGQLGDGTTASRLVPVQVQGLPGPAVAVAAGANHSLALMSDGTLWGWGDNSKYQISSAPLPQDSVARPIQAMRQIKSEPDAGGQWHWVYIPIIGVQAIAAGANHSLALTTARAVWASGDNSSRQLGAPRYNDRREEIDEGNWAHVPVPLDIPMVAVAAGEDFSLSLDENGRVWGWGNNASAQLGDSFGRQHDTPIEMLLFSGVQAIAAGDNHTLALKNDGNRRNTPGPNYRDCSGPFGHRGRRRRSLLLSRPGG